MSRVLVVDERGEPSRLLLLPFLVLSSLRLLLHLLLPSQDMPVLCPGPGVEAEVALLCRRAEERCELTRLRRHTNPCL